MRRFLLAFLSFLTLSLAALSAEAQADESSPESSNLDDAARSIFLAAQEDFENGEYERARQRFEAAMEVSGRTEMIFNLALCDDRLGRREQAIDGYREFLEQHPRHELAQRATRRRLALIQAREAEQAAAEGVEPGDLSQVDSEQDSGPSYAGPIALYAIGGAAAVSAIVASVMTKSRFDDAQSACDLGDVAGCESEETSSEIRRRALTADISWALAGVAIASAVVWTIVISGEEDEEQVAAIRVSPSAASVEVSF